MTISVRHPAISTTTPRAKRPTVAVPVPVPVVVPSPAKIARTLVDAARRIQEPPTSYRYSLTSLDGIFTSGLESAEAERETRKADRRSGTIVLAVGLVVLIVMSVATAILLSEVFHLTSNILNS